MSSIPGSLGFTGSETSDIDGVRTAADGGSNTAVVRAMDAKRNQKAFTVDVQVDTPQER